MEKQPHVCVEAAPHPPVARRESNSKPWARPSFYQRLPWDSFAALFLALCFAGSMVVVVVLSHNSPVKSWEAYRITPSVCLSIATVAIGICVRYAFSHAIVVAWWVQASRPRSTLADLHRQWIVGTSLKDAIFALRSFNLAAVATVALAILPAHSPLAQRASTVGDLAVNSSVLLTVPALAELSVVAGAATGFHDRQDVPVKLTPAFHKIVVDYLNAAPIMKNASTPVVANGTCRGRCHAVVKAAGYDVQCTPSTSPISITNDLPPSTNASDVQPITIFNIDFNWIASTAQPDPDTNSVPYSPALSLETTWKPEGRACPNTADSYSGLIQHRKCTLQPAIVEYPIFINTNGHITLDPAYDYTYGTRVPWPFSSDTRNGFSSGLGGFFVVGRNLFNSTVQAQFDSLTYSWRAAATQGSAWIRYDSTQRTSNEELLFSACDVYFDDPTHDMLMAMRELAFRMAVAAAPAAAAPELSSLQKETLSQVVTAVDVATVAVYKSQWLFLGLAALLVLLGACAVVPLVFGWWRLAYNVTLSPIEIANAFDAPLLAGVDTKLTAEEIVSHAGHLCAHTAAAATVPSDDETQLEGGGSDGPRSEKATT